MAPIKFLVAPALAALLVLGACQDGVTPPTAEDATYTKQGAGQQPGTGELTAGSNLSYPAIWSEGVSKNPRGTMGSVDLGGRWWWWWGDATVEGGDPLACAPDPDDPTKCDDGVPGRAMGNAPGAGAVRAYLQRDAYNEWQADNVNGGGRVDVDLIDWGDALESGSWSLTSKVRIETTLFTEVMTDGMLSYSMRHLYGHGTDEMWGVESQGGHAVTGLTTQAIVYSPCARLTIQKLSVLRDVLAPNDPRLTWDPVDHVWKETDLASSGDLVNDAAVINSGLVAEGATEGLKAEINIQGKVVYGMNWDVKSRNLGAGDYRITFSLADDNCAPTLNTFIGNGTQILVASEEGEEQEGSGGVGVVDANDNLTYIDVRITSTRGKGGGGKGGNGGNGGRGVR